MDYGIDLREESDDDSSQHDDDRHHQQSRSASVHSSSSNRETPLLQKTLNNNNRGRGLSTASAFDEVGQHDFDDHNLEDEEDAAFVLQYSTINGTRLKKDRVIGDFTRTEILKDNPVLKWTRSGGAKSDSDKNNDNNSPPRDKKRRNSNNVKMIPNNSQKYLFSPTITRVLTITLLLIIFFFPAIWNVLVAFFSYDSVVRQEEISIAARSNTSMIGTLHDLNVRDILVRDDKRSSNVINNNSSTSLCFNYTLLLMMNNSDSNSSIGDFNLSSSLPLSSIHWNTTTDNLPISIQSCFSEAELRLTSSNFSDLFNSIENRSLSYSVATAQIWKSVFPKSDNNRNNNNNNSSNNNNNDNNNNGDPEQTTTQRIIQAAKLSWNPYVFAIFSNVMFSILCLITYHRLELRRRVSALLMSYGTVCVNRWTYKRILAAIVFSVFTFFACFSTFSVVFGWEYFDFFAQNVEDGFETELTVVFNNNNNNRDNELYFWQDVRSSNSSSSSTAMVAAKFHLDDHFFWMQHPRIIETLQLLRNEDVIFDDAGSSSSSGAGGAAADSSSSSSSRLQTASLREFSASFMFFFSSFFGALLPYFFPLSMIWKRLTTPTILDDILFNFDNTRTAKDLSFTLSMISYITGSSSSSSLFDDDDDEDDDAHEDKKKLNKKRHQRGRLKFKCELDMLLKAARLVSFRIPRSQPEEQLVDDEHANQARGLNNKRPKIDEEYLGQGFIISNWFALHFLAGWSTPWRMKRTNSEHPHELLFGTTWGDHEEEVNAVLSVMFEHRTLQFLNDEIADDIRWNKAEVVGVRDETTSLLDQRTKEENEEEESNGNFHHHHEHFEYAGPHNNNHDDTNFTHHDYDDGHQDDYRVHAEETRSETNSSNNNDRYSGTADDDTHHEINL